MPLHRCFYILYLVIQDVSLNTIWLLTFYLKNQYVYGLKFKQNFQITCETAMTRHFYNINRAQDRNIVSDNAQWNINEMSYTSKTYKTTVTKI